MKFQFYLDTQKDETTIFCRIVGVQYYPTERRNILSTSTYKIPMMLEYITWMNSIGKPFEMSNNNVDCE